MSFFQGLISGYGKKRANEKELRDLLKTLRTLSVELGARTKEGFDEDVSIAVRGDPFLTGKEQLYRGLEEVSKQVTQLQDQMREGGGNNSRELIGRKTEINTMLRGLKEIAVSMDKQLKRDAKPCVFGPKFPKEVIQERSQAMAKLTQLLQALTRKYKMVATGQNPTTVSVLSTKRNVKGYNTLCEWCSCMAYCCENALSSEMEL